MTTEDEMRRLVSAPGIELFEREDGTWILITVEGVHEFDFPPEAIIALNKALLSHPAVEVTYHVDVDELTAWTDDERGLFPHASNGWSRLNVGWVPATAADDPTSSPTIIETFGDHGAAVYLHYWGSEYMVYVSGLEGEDSEWIPLGAISLEEAIGDAHNLLAELLDTEGLNFPSYMGLDNLPKSERYTKPDGVKLVERRTSFWDYGEEYICELEVYTRQLDGDEQWLVVDSETNRVIGEYNNIEQLDHAVTYDEYNKLTYEVEEVEDYDDEDDD